MKIAAIAKKYIEKHPSIRECMSRRLINYSQLARQILKEEDIPELHFDAMLVACQRYYRSLSVAGSAEQKIRALLEKSKIDIRTRIAVVVIEKPAYFDDILAVEKKARKSGEVFYSIEGTHVVTIVSSVIFLPEIKKAFKGSIIKIWEELVLVILESPRAIEETPGMLSHLLLLLSARRINIFETMSCWSETLFVVSQKDLQEVVSALSF